MYYYVYKVTNLTNGKFYIGKKGHSDPYTDAYMGSGRQIKAAIEKYGINNFKKEILQIFLTNQEAAEHEKSLVTKELIESKMSYNMHEGGHGGFAHINTLPPEERINIKAYRAKVKSGEIKVGGTRNWTEESYKKVREQGRKNLEIIREKYPNGVNTWENLSEEEKILRKLNLSERAKGSNNNAYGTHFYVDPEIQSIPNISVLSKFHRFKEGLQPLGWILVQDWRDNNKKKNGAYGKSWYNDGTTNYFLDPRNDKVQTLQKGRLSINNCCGFSKQRKPT